MSKRPHVLSSLGWTARLVARAVHTTADCQNLLPCAALTPPSRRRDSFDGHVASASCPRVWVVLAMTKNWLTSHDLCQRIICKIYTLKILAAQFRRVGGVNSYRQPLWPGLHFFNQWNTSRSSFVWTGLWQPTSASTLQTRLILRKNCSDSSRLLQTVGYSIHTTDAIQLDDLVSSACERCLHNACYASGCLHNTRLLVVLC